MPLVLIHAQAPWGPISLKTAESTAELLARGVQPAVVVDVGERDAGDVVREALRMLPPPMDATGQIPATVAKAQNSVVEAVSRVLVTSVATSPAKAVSDKPESHGGPMASGGEAEPEFGGQYAQAPAREVVAGNRTITGPRQPSAEVDAKAIRAGLGLSQPAFAKAFGIPLATLRDWEQGRSKPEGTGRTLLSVIEARPDAVRQALEGAGSQ